jgi:hypothetical protein
MKSKIGLWAACLYLIASIIIFVKGSTCHGEMCALILYFDLLPWGFILGLALDSATLWVEYALVAINVIVNSVIIYWICVGASILFRKTATS